MPRAAATPRAPRARKKASDVHTFFKPRSPAKRSAKGKAKEDEFADIEEISEIDFTAEELRRSAQRRAARALRRISSNAPSSSRAGPSSGTASDGREPEHIDLVASSSPIGSPLKPQRLSSTASLLSEKTPSRGSSKASKSSRRTRSPSPLPPRRTRRRIFSSDEDEDEPLCVEPLSVELRSVEPPLVQLRSVDPPSVDPLYVDPPSVDPPSRPLSTPASPPSVDSLSVEPPPVESPPVEPPPIEPPRVEPQTLDPPPFEPPSRPLSAPASPPPVEPLSVEPSSKPSSRPASPPRQISSKGKERANPDDEPAAAMGKEWADPDEDEERVVNDAPFLVPPEGAGSPDNFDDGWEDCMADMADFNDFHYEPIDIPDFEILPSTQVPRSRTPTPPCVSSDELPPPAHRTPQNLPGAAARAAALSMSFSPINNAFEDLTLVSALPDVLREFYENHFRRGADDDNDDRDPDAFGVAAVVPKRAPAGRGGGGRGGWRGRGRGARGKRGWAKRR
ncbi:unnamed protein product [Cutaneotrichosporon oleaginosum]